MQRNWDINLKRQIETGRKTPLYMQIVQAVILDIESGRLAPGTYLPSSRTLAETLGVNRKTVVTAYEDLVAQGWLDTSKTRGTFVCETLFENTMRDQAEPVPTVRDSEPGYPFRSPPSIPIAMVEGGGAYVDEGSPDDRLFPTGALASAFRLALRHSDKNRGLQYSDPRGSMALRAGLAEMLKAQRGLTVETNEICITRGSQQAIFLSALSITRPGDVIIAEALTYAPAIAAFKAIGARVFGVGLDDDGIRLDHLDALCRKHPVRAVFVTPHHQFPTTVSMHPRRRLELVELARKHNFAILEDDYDHEFHFDSQPLMPIASYAPEQTVYIGSLSKLLVPALRIGYVVAPRAVIDTMAHLISVNDAMGNRLIEEAVSRMLSNGELLRHARKARKVYSQRRLFLAERLQAELGEALSFDLPSGGLAFWLKFGDRVEAVEARAKEAGLRFAPSQSYKVETGCQSGLRVGFASRTPEELEEVIEALKAAMY